MRNNSPEPNPFNRSGDERSAEDRARESSDIHDKPEDEAKLQPEETTIELPDVKDIPGQEFVHAPQLGALADTTISSADEEGEGLFADDEDDELEILPGTEADVTAQDRRMLQTAESYMPAADENSLQQASMDNEDLDGMDLNEKSFGERRTASDLDIPGNTDDTRSDAMGQGDEENNYFSLGGDENDQNENRS